MYEAIGFIILLLLNTGFSLVSLVGMTNLGISTPSREEFILGLSMLSLSVYFHYLLLSDLRVVLV